MTFFAHKCNFVAFVRILFPKPQIHRMDVMKKKRPLFLLFLLLLVAATLTGGWPLRLSAQDHPLGLGRLVVQSNMTRYLIFEPNLAIGIQIKPQWMLQLEGGWKAAGIGRWVGRPVWWGGVFAYANGAGYRGSAGLVRHFGKGAEGLSWGMHLGYGSVASEPQFFNYLSDGEDYPCEIRKSILQFGSFQTLLGYRVPLNERVGMVISTGLGIRRGINATHVRTKFVSNPGFQTCEDPAGYGPWAISRRPSTRPTLHLGVTFYGILMR
jgi:hypothetical protein